MKNLLYFIFIILLTSCKKESVNPTKIVEPVTSPTPYVNKSDYYFDVYENGILVSKKTNIVYYSVGNTYEIKFTGIPLLRPNPYQYIWNVTFIFEYPVKNTNLDVTFWLKDGSVFVNFNDNRNIHHFFYYEGILESENRFSRSTIDFFLKK
jgi:hypothetical protein